MYIIMYIFFSVKIISNFDSFELFRNCINFCCKILIKEATFMTILLIIIVLFIISFLFYGLFGASEEEGVQNVSRTARIQKQEKVNREAKRLKDNFDISALYTYEDKLFAVDDTRGIIFVNKSTFSFSSLINAELIVQQTSAGTTETSKEGVVARSAVGWLVAGGAGAIIGGTTAKSTSTQYSTTTTKATGVILYFDSIQTPMFTISGDNNFVRKIFATAQAIIHRNVTQGVVGHRDPRYTEQRRLLDLLKTILALKLSGKVFETKSPDEPMEPIREGDLVICPQCKRKQQLRSSCYNCGCKFKF